MRATALQPPQAAHFKTGRVRPRALFPQLEARGAPEGLVPAVLALMERDPWQLRG